MQLMPALRDVHGRSHRKAMLGCKSSQWEFNRSIARLAGIERVFNVSVDPSKTPIVRSLKVICYNKQP